MKYKILYTILLSIINFSNLFCQDQDKAKQLAAPYMTTANDWYENYGKKLSQDELVMIGSTINTALEQGILELQAAGKNFFEKIKSMIDKLEAQAKSSPSFKAALDQMGKEVAPASEQVNKSNEELFGRIFAYYKKINESEAKSSPPLMGPAKEAKIKKKKAEAKTEEKSAAQQPAKNE